MNTALIKRSEVTRQKDSKAYFGAAEFTLIGLVLIHRTHVVVVVVVLLNTWTNYYFIFLPPPFVFTFKVGSDASVVAGRAAHQLVQEVRWGGGSGGPAGQLHLLTHPWPDQREIDQEKQMERNRRRERDSQSQERETYCIYGIYTTRQTPETEVYTV